MTTRIVDVIVPEIFSGRSQVITKETSKFINSGAVVENAELAAFLQGPGNTLNISSYADLANDADNVATDDTTTSTPKKIGTQSEVVVKLFRNQSWATSALSKELAHADPAEAIAGSVGRYWERRIQAAVLSVSDGVFADNVANDSSDLVHSVAGASFTAGVTNFTTAGAVDALAGMGEHDEDLGILVVHPVVRATMLKNKLIENDVDTDTGAKIETFLGRRVVVSSQMAVTSGVYDSLFLGAGAFQFALAGGEVPTEIERLPSTGNGAGAEVLYNRIKLCIHPTGFAYTGTVPDGGPSNTVLATATSFDRVYAEREQIAICKFVTREA